MFNSMVLPNLDYCCTMIWGTTSDTDIGKLQKIQNRGMRIILQCHPRTHIADMLSNLKYVLDSCPGIKNYAFLNSKLSHWLVPVSHQYGRAYKEIHLWDLFVPRSHPNSLTTKGTRLWNQLPTSIRTLPDLKTLKKPQLSSSHLISTSRAY